MLRWIASFFGLEPIKNPGLQDPTASQTSSESRFDLTAWPEGPQVRRHVRYGEPVGWAHSNWAWRSSGHIEHTGSLHPLPDKAEYRFCLGALECRGCGKIVRPKTKTAEMKAQVQQGCPNATCNAVLQWVTCEARTYHFVIWEGGKEYSVWKHEGSHRSHPRPPPGRQPPGIHSAPNQTMEGAASAHPRSVPLHSIAPAHRDRSETREGARKANTDPKTRRMAMNSVGDAALPPAAPPGISDVEAGPAETVPWSDLNIGRYALFRTVARGRLYAAKIIARNGETANLVWHSGNAYTRGEAPMAPTFTRATGECSDALEYASLNAVSNSKVGTIRWPLRLHEQAAFHSYANDTIQTALYDAFSSIFDIVAGTRLHPLTQLFDEHMSKMLEEFEAAGQRTVTDEILHGLAQQFSFPVPGLPGDQSLVEDFLADMEIQLRKDPEFAEMSLRVLFRLRHVAPALFNLVITREYLGQSPENDQDIFELVKQNRVFRIWTSHEQALAACHGEENTSPDSPLAQAPSPMLYNLTVIDDDNLLIPDDEPLVAIRSLQSVNWTSGPALSGGLRKPRRYTPPHLRLTATGPRPKPRPAHKKTVRFFEQPVVAGSSSKENQRLEELAIPGGEEIAEGSAQGRQSAKITRRRSPLGSIGENGELTYLRRSKRTRTASRD